MSEPRPAPVPPTPEETKAAIDAMLGPAVEAQFGPVKPPPKSVVEPVVAKSSATDTMAQKMDILLQLLLSQEARKAEEIQAQENARKARNAQRELSARTHVEKQLLKQARCRHLKGGANGPRSGVTDYSVYHHTFINGEQVIKCFLCDMKWKAQDTVDYLVRGGRRVANHTKIGWQQAMGFMAQSTNKPSRSEVPVTQQPLAEFNGVELS
jgi:hypothetical protein